MSYLKFENKEEAANDQKKKLIWKKALVLAIIVIGVVLAIIMDRLAPGSAAQSDIHNVNFVLMSVSDSLRIMGTSIVIYLFLLILFVCRKALVGAENKWAKAGREIFFGIIICFVLTVVTPWFVESGNVWFADKSNIRTERVYIEELCVQKKINEDHTRARQPKLEYVIAVSSPSGSGYRTFSVGSKPAYFDYLQKHCYYDAKVYDGYFGYSVILDFGTMVNNGR